MGTKIKEVLGIMGLKYKEAANILEIPLGTLASYTCGARNTPDSLIDKLYEEWNKSGGADIDMLLTSREKLKCRLNSKQ